jgi:hypothetical protein
LRLYDNESSPSAARKMAAKCKFAVPQQIQVDKWTANADLIYAAAEKNGDASRLPGGGRKRTCLKNEEVAKQYVTDMRSSNCRASRRTLKEKLGTTSARCSPPKGACAEVPPCCDGFCVESRDRRSSACVYSRRILGYNQIAPTIGQPFVSHGYLRPTPESVRLRNIPTYRFVSIDEGYMNNVV